MHLSFLLGSTSECSSYKNQNFFKNKISEELKQCNNIPLNNIISLVISSNFFFGFFVFVFFVCLLPQNFSPLFYCQMYIDP